MGVDPLISIGAGWGLCHLHPSYITNQNHTTSNTSKVNYRRRMGYSRPGFTHRSAPFAQVRHTHRRQHGGDTMYTSFMAYLNIQAGGGGVRGGGVCWNWIEFSYLKHNRCKENLQTKRIQSTMKHEQVLLIKQPLPDEGPQGWNVVPWIKVCCEEWTLCGSFLLLIKQLKYYVIKSHVAK